MTKEEKIVILRLVILYTQLLQEIKPQDNIDVDENRFGPNTSLNHLIWMLDEISKNDEQSVTKKHRWLGYIQAMLVAYNLIDVETQRDLTREILNGA